MKKIALVALFAFVIAGLTFAQGLSVEKIAGQKSISKDAMGNTVAQPRSANKILNNEAVTAWWSGPDTGYVNLDWGLFTNQNTNNLPDEVIDGFLFKYGTNNMDATGETFGVYFFDSCTGNGNIGVQEAGFTFAGLPNAATFGTLPPGYGWIVSVTVDLDIGGYQFLLGNEWGLGLTRWSVPMTGGTGIAIGAPELYGGNSYTGTQDRFDTYYPTGGYENTWWFGGGYPAAPWSTFPASFMGGNDGTPATNTSYIGAGAQGNMGGLYSIGQWTAGGQVDFFFKDGDGQTAAFPGWLLVSLNINPMYLSNFDITLIPSYPFTKTFQMPPDAVGDFDRLPIPVGAGVAGLRIYFQGAATRFGPIAPVDCSQGVVSN